jgi:hypothetical protein
MKGRNGGGTGLRRPLHQERRALDRAGKLLPLAVLAGFSIDNPIRPVAEDRFPAKANVPACAPRAHPQSGSTSFDLWYHPPPRRVVQQRKSRKKKNAKSATQRPLREGAIPTILGGSSQTMDADGSTEREGSPAVPTLGERFAPNTWESNGANYASVPFEFTGPEPGCIHPYGHLPSNMGLFDKFWSLKLQRRIVRETNRYASEEPEEKPGTTRGDLQWTPLCLEEFHAFISICLLMGLKQLLSLRLYWSTKAPFFKCHVISHLMTRERYELISRSLYVANAPTNVQDRTSRDYDLLHKLRWMIDEVWGRFQAMWSPNQ